MHSAFRVSKQLVLRHARLVVFLLLAVRIFIDFTRQRNMILSGYMHLHRPRHVLKTRFDERLETVAH